LALKVEQPEKSFLFSTLKSSSKKITPQTEDPGSTAKKLFDGILDNEDQELALQIIGLIKQFKKDKYGES